MENIALRRNYTEEDLDFALDLEHWRLRQVIPTLAALCSRVILKKFRDFRPSHVNSFTCLPRTLQTSLLALLKKTPNFYKPDTLPLVINEDTRQLDITFSRDHDWRDEKTIAHLFDLIGTTCKNLEGLYLAFDDGMRVELEHEPMLQEALRRMLMELGNLRHLHLQFADTLRVNDSIAKVIGATCSKLRVLCLSDSDVSDVGVAHLCGALGKCKKLTNLSLNATLVQVPGLVMALENLPHLVDLQHADIIAAVETLQLPPGHQLQLQTVHVGSPRQDDNFPFIGMIPRNLLLLKSLHINSDDANKESFDLAIQNLLKVQFLPNLSTLHLNGCAQTPELFNILMCYASKLTHLYISSFDKNAYIDLSIIGKNCLNLEELKFNATIKKDPETILNENHFQQLKSYSSFNSNTQNYPKSCLLSILSSNCLEHVDITKIAIEEKIVQDLKEFEHGVFSHLVTLKIVDCGVSLECYKQMLCLAPNLEIFQVNKEVTHNIQQFVNKHHMHCQVHAAGLQW